MTGNRIAWVDLAKVVCIWLMVCCHAGQKGMILNMTYQFHMPAFFIISGILFRPKGIWVTVKSFGIPILAFGSINLLRCIVFDFYKNHAWGGVIPLIYNWLKNFLFTTDISVFQGYWFVLTLLLMRLLMEIEVMRRLKVWIALACLLWCCIEPYLGISAMVTSFKPYHVISCLPFFVLGMVIKEKKIEVIRGSLEMKSVGAVIFFIITLIQGRIDLGGYIYGYSYLLLLINALIGSWLLFNICSLAPQRVWIQNLSTGTFLILGLHSCIYWCLLGGFHCYLGLYNTYLPLLVGLLVLGVCYPLIIWCEHKCPLILGKYSAAQQNLLN